MTIQGLINKIFRANQTQNNTVSWSGSNGLKSIQEDIVQTIRERTFFTVPTTAALANQGFNNAILCYVQDHAFFRWQASGVPNGTTIFPANDGGVWVQETIGDTDGTVTSIGISMPAAFTVANSPVTTSGVIGVTAAGTSAQYIKGDGTLGTLPTPTGGTVTNVSALTINSTGTDLSSTVANPTTTPVITLSVPTASAVNRGVLSPTDWSTFNSKQNALTLTTTGSSGSATFISNTLNVPTYTLSGLGGVPTSRQLTINGTAYDLSADRTWSVGTVTSVAALTLGTTGTDVSSTVANNTTTPVITLNIPTASAANRGALSSTDWTTFNNKQNTITLTTTGTSGAATLVGSTLNIPQYQSVITNPVTGTGTTNYLSKWTSSSSLNNSLVYDDGTNIGIGTTTPSYKLDVNGTGRFQTSITIGGAADATLFFPNTTSGHQMRIYTQYASNAMVIFANGYNLNLSGGGGMTSNFTTTITGTNGNAALTVQQGNVAWTPVLKVNAIGSTGTQFNTNGNVLIGTTTDAGYKLDVNGTARIQGNLTAITGSWDSTGIAVNNIRRNTDATLVINSSGSVNESLQFTATSSWGSISSGAIYGMVNNMNFAGTGTSSFINLGFTNTYSTSTSGRISVIEISGSFTTTNASSILRGFYYNPSVTLAGTHRAIETVTGDILLGSTSGNVGIGAAPFWKLQVSLPNNSGGSNVGVFIADINLAYSGNSSWLAWGKFADPAFNGLTSGIRAIYLGNNGYEQGMAFHTASGGVGALSSPGSTEVFRITNTRNLLIGTTTDAGYKLDVNGNSRIKGSGNTSATTTFRVENSSAGSPFTILGDGTVNMSFNASLTYNMSARGYGSNGGYPGLGVYLYSQNYSNAAGTAATIQYTGSPAGVTSNGLAISGGFALQSATFNAITVNSSWTGLGTNTFVGYLFDPTLDATFPANNIIAIKTTKGNVLLGTTSGSVGIGANTSINASAILDITSTTKGFLQPRMTTTQRDAIATPATGLAIYNTTTNTEDYYNGTTWVSLQTSAAAVKSFGAWQTNVTQTAAANNTGYGVRFNTADISGQGVAIQADSLGNNTLIKMANAGYYNIQFSFQFQNIHNADEDVSIWLRKNGQNTAADVSGSGGFVSVPSSHGGTPGHCIAAWNYFVQANANDYFQLVWSTTDSTHVTMEFYPAGSPPPSSASAILTVNQVN